MHIHEDHNSSEPRQGFHGDRGPGGFKRNTRAQLFIGVVLMFFGLFLIADMADIIPWRLRDYLFTWQTLLIVLGLIMISGRDSRGTGFILLLIGSFFLLPRIIHVPDYWSSLFWPSLLILLGLAVIFGGGRSCKSRQSKCSGRHKRTESGEDYLDDVSVFGGGDKIVNTQNFKGGQLTHIFGGSKIDFSRAVMAPGVNRLEVLFIFGGSKLIVPESWDVKVEVTSVFGGFSDKRIKTIVVADKESTLLITGTNVFGGGEIVNYV